jgi:predicted metal-dependent hydrolase
MKVRKPDFNFNQETPKHWLGGSPFKTHLCNSFTLMFPAGEKFFIRSVQKFLPKLSDERLKQEAKLFIKQEAQHYIEHEKFFEILRNQGYDIDRMIKIVDETIASLTEKYTSPETCLALTAGFEHLTALLSEIALSDDFFKDASPELKALFEWHAGEELEHRSVAFDVLEASDSHYGHRVMGLFGAYMIFSTLSGIITAQLMFQDKTLFKTKSVKEALDVFFLDQKLFPKALGIFARYLLPDFHPSRYQELEALVSKAFGQNSAMGVA